MVLDDDNNAEGAHKTAAAQLKHADDVEAMQGLFGRS
jgi:hypothetical protein